jgi:RHS repeat-associated protein
MCSESTAGTNPTESVFSYDRMGRIKDNSQCTPQNCGSSMFPITYTYDLDGEITSSTNGAGVTFTYAPNSNGSYTGERLFTLNSSLSGSGYPGTLFSDAQYNASGELLAATLGNGATESWAYTPRNFPQSMTTNGMINAQAAPGSGSVAFSGTLQSKQVQTQTAAPGTGSVSFSGTLQSKQVQTQAATSGNGSVTFSGSLQSKQVQTHAATAGTGSVTISGSEQSNTTYQTECFYYPPPTGTICYPVANTTYDYGTASITVNGVTMSATWGNNGASWSGTSATIASFLASAINGNGSSPVTASVSGSTITLVAKYVGSSTNYSLSSSLASQYGSFSSSPSGSTLTGGTNAVYTTVYDSGTSTIVVNGHSDLTSWSGSGTSASSIATGLAGSINGDGGSPVSASVSGSTVYLTAKTTGAGTNYSLSSSSSYDSSNFGGPSFGSSNSGSALTGGANAVFSTVYDSGTSTIVVNGHSDSTSWSGSGTSSSSIASGLAGSINGDGGSPVSASVSGGTVYLSAKTTGASTNYSLSSSSTYDSGNFGSPSFGSSNSGSALTGGTDAAYTTVYDSGTSTITVNGHSDSVNWSGSGTTASSIASGLASAINGDSGAPASASVSGGTVYLVSKTTGAATNYSLSSSSTYDSNNFTGPSFTDSDSGSNFTGGLDAGLTPGVIYSYGLTYAPDGDLLTGNDSANGNWTYGYDDFNRLVSSSQNNGAVAYSYSYDRFGNRWNQTVTAGAGSSSSLSFDASNRILPGSGVSYDAAGNVIGDGSHTYSYDAEERISQVDGGGTATYIYDAEGRRVRKTTSSGSVDYLYDLAGHEISEMSSSGAWNRGEVYASGRHVATYANGTTYFDHADWLGTERVRSAMAGASCETIASLPFGDGMSTSGSCDPSPMHFTGKQRDSETASVPGGTNGLDYFGARYDSSNMGRFMSPDWSAQVEPVPYAKLGDPQSLDLYVYVQDNPVGTADADGHAFGLDDLAGIVIGGASGIVVEVVKDEVIGAKITPGALVAAGVGGALFGEGVVNAPETGGASLVAAEAGKGAAEGAALNLVQQSVDVSTGNQKSFSIKSLAVSTAVGAASAGVASKVPDLGVEGVSSGRGNMRAVAKAIRTKIANGTASEMSLKTAIKGAIGAQVANAGRTAIDTAAEAAKEVSECSHHPSDQCK